MKKIKQILKKQGFTLVELIIVIAIIAVLAVAAFMMLTKWLGKSRDSRRLSDIGTIARGLQVGYSDTDDGVNMYPTVEEQEGAIALLSGAEEVGYQGVVDMEVVKAASMQKAPLDPSDQNEYTYLVSQNRQKFQVLAMLEDGTEVSALNNVFALDYSNRIPASNGFELGVVLRESDNLPANLIGETVTGVNLADGSGYKAVVNNGSILVGAEMVNAPIVKEEAILESVEDNSTNGSEGDEVDAGYAGTITYDWTCEFEEDTNIGGFGLVSGCTPVDWISHNGTVIIGCLDEDSIYAYGDVVELRDNNLSDGRNGNTIQIYYYDNDGSVLLDMPNADTQHKSVSDTTSAAFMQATSLANGTDYFLSYGMHWGNGAAVNLNIAETDFRTTEYFCGKVGFKLE